MRLAYVLTTALVATASIATITSQVSGQSPLVASASAAQAITPRPGAPVSFADLVDRLQPAVVNISTKEKIQIPTGNNPFAGTPFEAMFKMQGGGQTVTREVGALGSGFLISSDGYIVTNNHVVAAHDAKGEMRHDAVASVTIILENRKEYPATIVGRDEASDIAVLKINATGLPFVRLGESSKSRVGDWVIAIGNPDGLNGTVTAGIVSAIRKNLSSGAYGHYIQTDTAINPGNSGGPMFDMNGNVIGINQWIASPNGGSVGLGFAIPADVAKPIIETLKGGAAIHRGYLGVQTQPVDENVADALGLQKGHGDLVQSLVPGGAAVAAGIHQGDVIIRVNNQEVTQDSTLSFIVTRLAVGAHVPIDVIRNGSHLTLTAVLAERPSEAKLASLSSAKPGSALGGGDEEDNNPVSTKAALGLSLQAITSEIAQQLGVPENTKAVVVAAVDPSSDAAAHNFSRGDIIYSVNNRAVATVAQFNAAVAAAKAQGHNAVLLQWRHGNEPALFVAVKINSDR